MSPVELTKAVGSGSDTAITYAPVARNLVFGARELSTYSTAEIVAISKGYATPITGYRVVQVIRPVAKVTTMDRWIAFMMPLALTASGFAMVLR